MKNFYSKSSTLNFWNVSVGEVREDLLNLSSTKATKNDDIPAKILKKSVDIYIKEITFIINDCIENGIFPDVLKLADVSPLLKKEDSFKKENYRPCSILLHMPIVFARIFINKLILWLLQNFLLICVVIKKILTLHFALDNDRSL